MGSIERWGVPPGGIEGPLGMATIRRVESLHIPDGSDADVMAASAVQLARSADAAAMKGQAAAVGAAARELREAMTRITADLVTKDESSPESRLMQAVEDALRAPDASPIGATASIFG